MKPFLKILTSLLLLFNGIGAIYGGGSLILQRDGSGISLSLDLLEHTTFHDYFIPGLTLFIINGVFSISVFIILLLNRRNYSRLVVAQGAILIAWIIIQIFLIQAVHFFHFILGFVGIALVILGIFNRQIEERSEKRAI